MFALDSAVVAGARLPPSTDPISVFDSRRAHQRGARGDGGDGKGDRLPLVGGAHRFHVIVVVVADLTVLTR